MPLSQSVAGVLGPLADGGRTVLRSLLDLAYPENCVLCGAEHGECPWSVTGPLVAGLTRYDGPHLCRGCAEGLAPAVVSGILPKSGIPVYAGRTTGPELVSVLAQWKYHGVRGLAWPLAPLVRAAVDAAMSQDGSVDHLVPVSLHGRRRRMRGFNQAAVLARLAVAGHDIPVHTELLRRIRPTGQQAKLDTESARRHNVAGAFAAQKVPSGPGNRPVVGLIDDLVTGGATCEAAVLALATAGWEVRWVAALGLAGGMAKPMPEAGHGGLSS